MIVLGAGSLGVSLLTAAALGVSCAVLSVIVVVRRWAFIGEGIAHAGLGGAGVAWALAICLPQTAFWTSAGAVYGCAVASCILVAIGIAGATRRQHVHVDTAIGIFLVTSLAWGFVAHSLYRQANGGVPPPHADEILFGQSGMLEAKHLLLSLSSAVGTLGVLTLLGKEILAYCFDPALAESSGVRSGVIHYLLILLIALNIVLGLRLMGSLLVVALLVLPGATALQLSRRFRPVLAIAVGVGLLGTVAGPLARVRWPVLPEGPAIVLALVAQFAAAFAYARFRGRARGE